MRRAIPGWIFAVAGVALLALYYIFNPATSQWAPKCMFHAVTGLDCPGCGSQRMLHALIHGDFAAAWSANPFLLCAAPAIILLIIAAARRTRFPRLYQRLNSPVAIAVYVVLLLGWTVWRNIF